MDKEILVERLKSAFSEVHLNGPEINAFVLSPSYGGAVRDSYILGVSAPSLALFLILYQPYWMAQKIISWMVLITFLNLKRSKPNSLKLINRQTSLKVKVNI